MDKAGFRIGIGKDQMVVTKKKRAQYLGIASTESQLQQLNISVAGDCISGFLVMAG